ncbi:MAG TPA: hypothetical protein VGI39_26850 [Polyangiaceae bacterium]
MPFLIVEALVIFERRVVAALFLAPLLALAAVPLACGGSQGAGGGLTSGDAGGSATGEGGSAGDDGGGGGGGGGGGQNCSANGVACTAGSDCCSSLCLGGQCAASISACGAPGTTCAVSTDCCNGACVNGTCGATQCVSIGDTCPTAGNACCTGTCTNGKCATITPSPTCTTAGNTCKANADCCSGLCTNGTCDIASSFCVQTNDICYHDADCCTGVCASPNANAVSATNPGTCGAPPKSGGVNCTGVDGTLCNPADVGCSGGCCSALCAPFGPTGVAICQQAQGCHVEGDLCRVNGDCCGGESPDAGILGGGLVVCSTSVNGGSIGVCMTPNGSNGGGSVCVPEGDVCHYNGPGYNCSVSAKRSDCCGDQNPKFLACQLDKLGVPRCLAYGLDDGGACREPGSTCATAADCCNGNPCVPNATGQLTCASSACIPSSGACTSSADCCAGITCVVPVGAQKGTCAPVPPPPPPPGTDAGSGTPDAGGGPGGVDAGGGLGCASLGQSCASLGCCTGLSCSNGSCLIQPK